MRKSSCKSRSFFILTGIFFPKENGKKCLCKSLQFFCIAGFGDLGVLLRRYVLERQRVSRLHNSSSSISQESFTIATFLRRWATKPCDTKPVDGLFTGLTGRSVSDSTTTTTRTTKTTSDACTNGPLSCNWISSRRVEWGCRKKRKTFPEKICSEHCQT